MNGKYYGHGGCIMGHGMRRGTWWHVTWRQYANEIIGPYVNWPIIGYWDTNERQSTLYFLPIKTTITTRSYTPPRLCTVAEREQSTLDVIEHAYEGKVNFFYRGCVLCDATQVNYKSYQVYSALTTRRKERDYCHSEKHEYDATTNESDYSGLLHSLRMRLRAEMSGRGRR